MVISGVVRVPGDEDDGYAGVPSTSTGHRAAVCAKSSGFNSVAVRGKGGGLAADECLASDRRLVADHVGHLHAGGRGDGQRAAGDGQRAAGRRNGPPASGCATRSRHAHELFAPAYGAASAGAVGFAEPKRLHVRRSRWLRSSFASSLARQPAFSEKCKTGSAEAVGDRSP